MSTIVSDMRLLLVIASNRLHFVAATPVHVLCNPNAENHMGGVFVLLCFCCFLPFLCFAETEHLVKLRRIAILDEGRHEYTKQWTRDGKKQVNLLLLVDYFCNPSCLSAISFSLPAGFM